MSSVTTQLRYIVHQLCDDKDIEDYTDESNWPDIANDLGLSDYPIYDETHRDELNAKIIRHYWLREIGSETVAQFKWRLRDAMFLVMPRYNWEYEQLDKLIAQNAGFSTRGDSYTETYIDNKIGDRKQSQENLNCSLSNASSTDISDSTMNNQFEDTPMDMLGDENYATNRTNETNHVSDTTNSLNNSTNTGHLYADDDENWHSEGTRTHDVTGYDRSAYEQMKERYDAYRNIDLSIVNDPYIKRCFLGVWM